MKDMIQIFKMKWNESKMEFIGSILFLGVLGFVGYVALNIFY